MIINVLRFFVLVEVMLKTFCDEVSKQTAQNADPSWELGFCSAIGIDGSPKDSSSRILKIPGSSRS